jgi:hypothetical protein
VVSWFIFSILFLFALPYAVSCAVPIRPRSNSETRANNVILWKDDLLSFDDWEFDFGQRQRVHHRVNLRVCRVNLPLIRLAGGDDVRGILFAFLPRPHG